MRSVFGLVLIMGVSLAGFAAWKTSDYINKTKAAEVAARKQIVPTVPVFVATKPLPFGHVLTPDDVVAIAWPRNAMPENVFNEKDVLFPGDGSQQRTVLRQMEKHEPILALKVTEPGADAGLNTRLERGMRAFTIRVDSTSGVSGLLRPGDRVDVYWTGQPPTTNRNDGAGEITKLIESSLQIVAVDQSTSAEFSGAGGTLRAVTVQVSPQQVGRLAQAQVSGKLALSLVGITDDTASAALDVDKRGLLGIVTEEFVPEEEAKVCTIRTRRGADVVEIPIPCTN